MTLTVGQCRAGRALLGWTANDLAAAASVGIMTVHRFEGGQRIAAASLNKIKNAFSGAGVLILAPDMPSAGGGEGVRLARPLAPPG
jgi:hypothetical protein